jgi:methionyl-tRNA synthetase
MTGFDVAYFAAHAIGSEGDQPSHEESRKWLDEMVQLAGVYPTQSGTSESAHVHVVYAVLRAIMRRSWSSIYKANYEGRCCLHDQIDISGSSRPVSCPVCGRPGELVSEERYFFRLSAFQGRLQALYRYRPQFLQPGSRRQEIEQFIAAGMKDIPLSRKSVAGVPWPDDSGQVVQNYFSELVTYLGALGFNKEGHASDDFDRYWPADLQVLHKVELWQHSVCWPALLIAADIRVPRHIFAHGALSFDERPTDLGLLAHFARTFGSDAIRYCLLREVPYDGDAKLSFERLAAQYDTEIVNGYGSLARKILMLVTQYSDGKIPVPAVTSNFDPGIERRVADARRAVGFLFDHYDVREGLNVIQRLIAAVGNALADFDPSAAVNDPGRDSRVRPSIHDACQALAIITLMLHPALPRATASVWKGLGRPTRLEDQIIDQTPWGVLRPGTPIGPIEDAFPFADKAPNSLA